MKPENLTRSTQGGKRGKGKRTAKETDEAEGEEASTRKSGRLVKKPRLEDSETGGKTGGKPTAKSGRKPKAKGPKRKPAYRKPRQPRLARLSHMPKIWDGVEMLATVTIDLTDDFVCFFSSA